MEVHVNGQPIGGLCGGFNPSNPGKKGGNGIPSVKNDDRSPYGQWDSHIVTQPKLLWSEKAGEEVGGLMLSVTGMDRFYYLRNFHDFHCKNSRALSIIHRQLNRVSEKDEVFIVMSKGRRKVRLFVYDNRSFSLYEQYFMPGYRFMRVSHDDEEEVYSITWKDVALLLQNPVAKSLDIK